MVDVRHQASAVFAADAVARIGGIPGVAAVTAGPGLTNTVTALKNARPAQSPVVVLGGATAGLKRAADILASARSPLLIIGSQAMLHPGRSAELASALETIGLPVYLTGIETGNWTPATEGNKSCLLFFSHAKPPVRKDKKKTR